MATTPVFLPREFHGQRSLEGYSPWGCKELDMTERFSLSLFIFIAFYKKSQTHTLAHPVGDQKPFSDDCWKGIHFNLYAVHIQRDIYSLLMSWFRYAVCAQSLSFVQLFASLWIVALQAPLPMEFFRQGYWSGFPFPSPGNHPDPGIKPGSPALQADPLPSEFTRETHSWQGSRQIFMVSYCAPSPHFQIKSYKKGKICLVTFLITIQKKLSSLLSSLALN